MLWMVSGGAATAPVAGGMRFAAIDVMVDSKEMKLGAWQVEVVVAKGNATIVGVEGGEHAAYKKAPYYDAKALAGGRIIVAAFDAGADLPMGETRVARLHM